MCVCEGDTGPRKCVCVHAGSSNSETTGLIRPTVRGGYAEVGTGKGTAQPHAVSLCVGTKLAAATALRPANKLCVTPSDSSDSGPVAGPESDSFLMREAIPGVTRFRLCDTIMFVLTILCD